MTADALTITMVFLMSYCGLFAAETTGHDDVPQRATTYQAPAALSLETTLESMATRATPPIPLWPSTPKLFVMKAPICPNGTFLVQRQVPKNSSVPFRYECWPSQPIQVAVPVEEEVKETVQEMNVTSSTKRLFGSNSSSKTTLNTRVTYRLCGYPPYSNRQACRKLDYINDPLLECEVKTSKVLFGIIIGIVAIAIIFLNCLIFIVITRYTDMRNHFNYIKASLAVADAMVGLLLLATVLPNMAWIRSLSDRDMIEYTRRDTNSPTAIVVGSFLTVTVQASLFHLCFLSIERFLAIRSLFWTMERKTKSVLFTIAGIWITSIILAFLPAIFPTHFEYKFQPALLIHLFTMKSTNGTNTGLRQEGIAYTLITLILPFAIMISFCIATAIVLYGKFRSAQRLFGRKSTGKSNAAGAGPIHPELSVYVTMVIMITAYTVTLSWRMVSYTHCEIPSSVRLLKGFLSSKD